MSKDWEDCKRHHFQESHQKKHKATPTLQVLLPASQAQSCLWEQSLPGSGEPPALLTSQSPPCPHTHTLPRCCQPHGPRAQKSWELLSWQGSPRFGHRQQAGLATCSPGPFPGSRE